MDYALTMGNHPVGKVSLSKEGLYYRVLCHADLYGSVMYRLAAVSQGVRISIGILSPMDGGYGLDRKIPRSRLMLEGLSFLLLPSHEPMAGKFVPISPEEPFSYLELLKDAYLAKQDAQLGLVIPLDPEHQT